MVPREIRVIPVHYSLVLVPHSRPTPPSFFASRCYSLSLTVSSASGILLRGFQWTNLTVPARWARKKGKSCSAAERERYDGHFGKGEAAHGKIEKYILAISSHVCHGLAHKFLTCIFY